MTGTKRSDVWSVGDAYEPYVGRWSRAVAVEFVDWLAVPAGGRWLDVGCGTGALSQTILKLANPQRVVGIDPSAAFVAYAREHIRDSHVTFRTGDAQDLPLESASFDCVASGLVLNFVLRQDLAVAEMRRVARPGAIVAAYVWDYAGEMQLMRYFWNAAIALNPATRALDEGNRFPDCKPESLTRLLNAAGLQSVETKAIVVPTRFKDFDDYWSPFLGGQGPAPGYCVSLPERDRTALRERIRQSLPTERDGSIPLTARAWAVKGIK